MSDLSPEPIFQIASGYMAAKHLLVAVEIGLFEALKTGPMTVDELAQRTNIPRRTLRIITDAMVALGVIERTGDRYHNGPTASTFLSGSDGPDLRPFLRLLNRVSYPRWIRLEDAVRTDRIIFGESGFTKEERRLYSAGVEAVTAGTAQALAASYDFAPHRRILDLGGGTGSFLLAILTRYQNLQCTLYDLPQVTAAARECINSNPLGAAIQVIAGDFFHDSIPEGHDAVIIANIVHCFATDRVMHLLRRVRNHVPPEARLLLVDFWTDKTHTQPVFAALMAGEFLLTPGGGDVYSVDEAQQWLHDAGWKVVTHTPLAGPASLIVGEA
jgi:SAM-dependent methyltransferase